ncbi:MAG: hypothetical protein JOZ70_03710 [Pseudolabrys sp.]|nr:hypothetical protein [Pseudolabrys sp.]
MKKSIAMVAAAVAATAFTVSAADAHGHKRVRDDRAALTSSVVSGVSQGVAWGIHSSQRAVSHTTAAHWGVWGWGVAGCLIASPIVTTIVLNRPLTTREVLVGSGNCVVPIIGGLVVDAVLAPAWEPAPKVVKRGKKKKMM